MPIVAIVVAAIFLLIVRQSRGLDLLVLLLVVPALKLLAALSIIGALIVFVVIILLSMLIIFVILIIILLGFAVCVYVCADSCDGDIVYNRV